jgi:hypothetical protein
MIRVDNIYLFGLANIVADSGTTGTEPLVALADARSALSGGQRRAAVGGGRADPEEEPGDVIKNLLDAKSI